MPNPLEQLKAYFATGGSGSSDQPYAPWQRTLQSGFEGGMEGLKGLAGIGDDSTANKVGQMVSAVAPFGGAARRAIGEVPEGIHPAITALLKVLGKASESSDVAPAINWRDTKVGGNYIPARSMIMAPEGFELPEEMGLGKFITRDPALADQYAAQRTNAATGGTMEDLTRYGGRPDIQTSVKPKAKSGLNAPVEGFESKFSSAGLGLGRGFGSR